MADAFPISGQIDPKAFPFLLMDLHRQGATGSLKVEGPSYQKALYYRAGRVLFGSSNDPRDQLGAILIEEGKLTPEQLDDVNAKVGPGSPLAKVLADSGYVSQRELGEAARTKVERILSDVIAYESGSFEFEDGVLPKGAVDLKLATERLVLAAVRRVGDRGFVLRHLGGLDVVLAPSPNAVAAEIQSESAALLSQIDGRRTLKDAAARTSFDEFEVAKLACALLFLGFVEKAPSSAAAATDMTGFDLVSTARMAFGEEPTVVMPPPSAEPEAATSAFFIGDSQEPPAFVLPEAESAAPATSPGLEPEPPTLIVPPPPAALRPAVVAPPVPAPQPAPPPPPVPPPRPAAALSASGPTSIPIISPPARPTRQTGAVPEIPVPPPPSAPKPSKEDLAALDALLNSRTSEGPLTPFEKPSAPTRHWEPRFGEQAGARRGQRERGVNPLLLGIAGVVVLLGAAGAAAYYWYTSSRAKPGPAVAVATPRPTPPPPTTVAESPATSAEASATPPAATVASAVPTAPPALVTPTPRPPAEKTPAEKAPVTGGSLADARSLMEKGLLERAARVFAANLKASPTGTYSVQLLVACSADTVTKAVSSISAQELYIVPVSFKGRDCFRICWGLYESETRASSAARSVPEYFLKGGAKPKVVPASTLLP